MYVRFKSSSEDPLFSNVTSLSDSIYKKYNFLLKKLSGGSIEVEGRMILLINELLFDQVVIDKIRFEIEPGSYSGGIGLGYDTNVNYSQKVNKLCDKYEIPPIPNREQLIIKTVKSIDLPKANAPFFLNLNAIFGRVFEKLVNKKEIGAYYTSEDTTNYIVENSILSNLIKAWAKKDKKLEEHISNFKDKNQISLYEHTLKNNKSFYFVISQLIKKFDKTPLIDCIKKIKIADISCGSGSFIFASYAVLKALRKSVFPNDKGLLCHDFFQKNLFGIDIDPHAIEILKFRIKLEKVIAGQFFTQQKKHLENFIVADSLLFDFGIGTNPKKKINKFPKQFDVLVGNPPYVEYQKTKYKLFLSKFKSFQCNNLYALILERNNQLLKTNGDMGMIVPVSFISTKRMNSIRNLLIDSSDYLFISNFADRPSSLFIGVHQKLNIILLSKKALTEKCNIYTSSYLHWYSFEKNTIFKNLTYIQNLFPTNNFIFKIGNEIEQSIIRKLVFSNKSSLMSNTTKNGNYKVYLNMRMTFWAKSFLSPKKSNEYKVFQFKSKSDSILFSAFLNSNIFFFLWEAISDVWHITYKELNCIKINFSEFDSETKRKIVKFYLKFEKEIEKNKKVINSKQSEFEYHHKKSKVLIDKLDRYFSTYFSLTLKEYEYMRNYQLKYRLNDELENYLNRYSHECN